MMKNTPKLLAALLLSIGALTIASTPAFAQRAESKENKDVKAAPVNQEVVRKEFVKIYEDFQNAMKANDVALAKEKLNQFKAFENKTAYETFFIARNSAALASQLKDNAALGAAFEDMIASDFTKPEDKLRFTEAMASTFYEAKNYAESKKWASRALALNANSTIAQDLYSRSIYLMDDFAGTVQEIHRQIKADGDKAPAQDRLRILHSSYVKLKDNAGRDATMELLVKHYPTKEYWADLIYQLPNKPGFSDRLTLDWYRLLLATDNMEDELHFTNTAELAVQSGYPSEAKAALDSGYAAGVLGKGKNAAKHKALLDKVTKSAADDAKKVDADESAAKTAKTGLAMVNTGYNMVLLGQNDRGLALMEMGMEKGGLKFPNEAKLHLVMAYLKAGKRDKAEEVAKTVSGSDGCVELTRYWMMKK
jgi:hypothetical protein